MTDMTVPSDTPDPNEACDDDEAICGESFDHDLRTTYGGADGTQWECRRCGAEGWDDVE